MRLVVVPPSLGLYPNTYSSARVDGTSFEDYPGLLAQAFLFLLFLSWWYVCVWPGIMVFRLPARFLSIGGLLIVRTLV